MEELKALVGLISRNKLKQIDLLDVNNSKKSKVQDLYLEIATAENLDEEHLKKKYYGSSPHRDNYFSRLKRKLKERLIDSLFLIDTNQPEYTDIQKAYYNCYKDLAAAKILIGRYLRKPAIDILERALRKAIHFEFTDIVLEVTRNLRLHYGTIIGDKSKFDKYNNLLIQYTDLLTAELKAEQYYSNLASNFAKSSASNFELLGEAIKYYDELREVLKTNQSYRLYLYSFNVFSYRYQIANDYKKTLVVCDEALKLFKNKKHLASNTAIFSFQFKKVGCYIQLKEYKEAEKSILHCLDLVQEGSFNWFLSLDYYMILCFHSGNLQKAYDILNTATSNENYLRQYKNISENWKIHEAYIHYFMLTKHLKVDKRMNIKKFRLQKFLNEVPTVSKDKRGTNITILILQILFLLQQKKYYRIIDKIEPLKAYNHRYLRKDETFRSHCFIKMLLQLPQNSFHKAAVIRKAEKYKKKLYSVPLKIANQASEVEIVPYEALWEQIIESLDNKFLN